MIIYKDQIGLWTVAQVPIKNKDTFLSWIARPIFDTSFKEGQDINTFLFKNTTKVGVGKISDNQYQEYWTIYNIIYDDYKRVKLEDHKWRYEMYKQFTQEKFINK